MSDYRTFVGLDVHARTIVGSALDATTGEVLRHRFGSDLSEVVAWTRSLPGPQIATYEAGPTGFGLYRRLLESGTACLVAAPSKLQRPSGDRVKTDARDAFHLMRLLHLDEITAVTVPSVEEETARDLVRSREDTRQDLMSARHRLSKLLLRHGFVYDDGPTWTRQHDRWVREHRVGDLAFTTAFDANYEAVVRTSARRDRLDKAITTMAEDSPFTPLVNRVGCLRGISTLTGFALAVEITDWHRFTGSTIGAYLGLVPSEHSSGRAGNERLHHQWVAFTARNKRPVVANVAVARADDQLPQHPKFSLSSSGWEWAKSAPLPPRTRTTTSRAPLKNALLTNIPTYQRPSPFSIWESWLAVSVLPAS